MTIEEKQIKLAKIHFGYEDFDWLLWCDEEKCPPWIGRKLHGAKVGDDWVQVYDYFNDLNAVHQLEKVLIFKGGLPTYEHFLRFNEINDSEEPWYGSIHATAAQRCEAIGKTLNLW